MSLTTCVIAAALAAIPKVPSLDFSKLPQKSETGYDFTIHLQLANRKVIDLQTIEIGSGSPETAITLAFDAFEDKNWNKYRDGMRLIILDYGGVTITGVKVTGMGARPTVQWKLRPSPPPKKK